MPINDFLKHLGFREDFISKLDDPDFDWKAEAEAKLEELGQLHAQKNPPDISDKIQAAKIAAQKDLKQKLGKAVGLMKSRAELETMSQEDFIEAIVEPYQEAMKKGSTDEKLKSELDDFRNKYLTAQDQLDELKTLSQQQIEAAQKAAQNEIRQFKVNQVMDSTFQAIDWGVPAGAVPALVKGFKAQINEMPWTINEDGSLAGPNGSGLAIDFTGKGHYKHISEAINALAFDVMKKSNGGSGGGSPAPANGLHQMDDKAKAAVEALEARMGLK